MNPKPLPQKAIDSNRQVNNNMPKSETSSSSISRPTAAVTGFDPFDSLITSGNSNKKGYSLNVFECPVCGRAYGSEEEVSTHVDSCLNSVEANNVGGDLELSDNDGTSVSGSELESFIGAYVSGKPSDGSVEIVLKLLRNIVKEPQNAKFRRVRMGNQKIREAISEVTGGVELLECVGFGLREEDGEMWAVMELPSEEQIVGIKKAISLLEPQKVESMPSAAPQKVEKMPSTAPSKIDEPVEPTKVDRQVKCSVIFFFSMVLSFCPQTTNLNLSMVELIGSMS